MVCRRETRCRHLGQQSTATAYIQYVQPAQYVSVFWIYDIFPLFFSCDLKEFFADELHADWVHLVEEAELALFVPPFGGEAGKVGYLGGVDR
jgi:hypothetical protein